MARKSLLAILSIVLAIAVPLFMAWQSQSNLKTWPIIKVKIAAYDPRDLLYGHYMTFQFDWNWKGGKPVETACYGTECCLCVGAGARDPEVEVMYCKDAANRSCSNIVKGSYSGGTAFDIGQNRYYVDETIALPLEKLFRGGKETFRIGVGVLPKGKTVLEKMYVGDQSLDEYLAERSGIVPETEPDPDTVQ